MKHIKPILVVAALAAVLAVPAAAKSMINFVTVAGPDWHGEIEITDPEVLASLNMGVFLKQDRMVSPPADLDRGYLITRGYEDNHEQFMFDRMVYFPGSPGVAYYLEIVDGSGPMDGNWYEVSDPGAKALRLGLTAKGVRLPEPESVVDTGKSTAEFSTDMLKQPIQRSSVVTVPAEVEPPTIFAWMPEIVGLFALTLLIGGAAGWTFQGMRARKQSLRH